MLRTILRNIGSIESKTFLLLIIPILSGNIKSTTMFYWGGGKENGSTPIWGGTYMGALSLLPKVVGA